MNKPRLIESVKAHEGLSLKPYKCTADKLTIGYGRNLDDNGISANEALAMLENDIESCCKELDKNFPGWRGHDDARQNVLIEMVFNLGAPRLGKFFKMWAALDRRDYDEAAYQMLDSRWSKQVGQRSKTLATQMREGFK
jgi:lysozyme